MTIIARPAITLIAAALALGLPAVAYGDPFGPSRVELDNGVTLLLAPISGVDHVAVEAIYPIGFFHEPAGMTQAAHLLEHLICQCATKSFGPGESFDLLKQVGWAHAETFPGYTHYAYVLAPQKLELALRIESERLSSLSITEDVIRREAPKCYREADFGEEYSEIGEPNLAFSALSQAWRHGAGSVKVRSGLESISTSRLEAFRQGWYRPENLTLVIAGAFDRERALELAKRHFGGLKGAGKRASVSTDWSKVPKRATITWDTNAHAICLALPPAEDPIDNLMLSIWGTLLSRRMTTDPGIRDLAYMTVASSTGWHVGPPPFFVCSMAKSESDIPRLEARLRTALKAGYSGDSEECDGSEVERMLAELSQSRVISPQKIRQEYERLPRGMGHNVKWAEGIVLGNLALQWGAWDVTGMASAAAKVVEEGGSLERLRQAVKRNVDVAKVRVTILKPMG